MIMMIIDNDEGDWLCLCNDDNDILQWKASLIWSIFTTFLDY